MTSDDTIRSLPDLIQFNAENNPDHVFCVQEERSKGRPAGLVQITFSQLRDIVAQCIERISSHLVGLNSPEADTNATPIGLFLESDVTLFVHISALLWMKIPVVLISKRLNSHAVAHLLSKTGATVIICSSRTEAQVSDALKLLQDETKTPKVMTAVPYLELMTQKVSERCLTYRDSLIKSSVDDTPNALYLHSSGTTGLPKPIALAHRYLLTYAACHRLKEHEAEGRLNVSTLPLYHGFGLLAPCLSLSIGKTCCFPTSTVVPSSESTVRLLKESNAKSLMTVPIILEQVVGKSAADDYSELARLDFVAIGGGALKNTVGNTLKDQDVTLLNHYGASELGPLAYIHIPEETYDWHFLRIRNDTGLRLTESEAISKSGRLFTLSGRPFGWDTDFVIQDSLVMNAQSASNGYVEVRITGRTDDLIVLSTGEKVWPQVIESHLEALQIVKTAVVFGEQQDEIGVLVELQDLNNPEGDQSSIDRLWSSIQGLNQTLDGHARISSEEAILIKPQCKDIPRSDKGSVMRQEVYRAFSGELQGVYHRMSTATPTRGGSAIDKRDIEGGLRSLIALCLQDRIASTYWKTGDDFFELGMDSLEATRLARGLGRLPNKEDFPGLSSGKSGPLLIYQNPTLGQLAAAMLSAPLSAQQGRLIRMETLKIKHTREMRLCQRSPRGRKWSVLLTGSTGSLGAHLLYNLAKNQSVERIICLNRASSNPKPGSKSRLVLRERQENANARHGLAFSAEMWNKVHLLASDVSKQDLGLKPQVRSQIVGQVTHILHNAWPMDFQRTLESLEGQVHAIRNLLGLIQEANIKQNGRKVKLVFFSSIAVAGRCAEKLVLEGNLPNPDSTVPMGYAEGKWVCEEVLASATQSMGDQVEPIIIRVGQLSGSSTTGYWNPTEHLAAILKSSHEIAAFPDLQGVGFLMLAFLNDRVNNCQAFSWLPVDVAAKVIYEISFTDRCPSRYYHVENPVRQPWSQFVDYLQYNFPASLPELLPFKEWLDSALISAGPGGIVPLEGFLREDFQRLSSGELILDTRNALRASPTLRSYGGISLELMDKYVRSWKAEGILPN
ncbi:MAG: hypothetical protein Q9219_003933 [cf. Caloplaca sp. 3 TL-2023]